jgi:hypothetical protein
VSTDAAAAGVEVIPGSVRQRFWLSCLLFWTNAEPLFVIDLTVFELFYLFFCDQQRRFVAVVVIVIFIVIFHNISVIACKLESVARALVARQLVLVIRM